MWADVLELGVEVFDEQDEAKVSVLKLVLVARVPANTTGMPELSGKLDHRSRLLEQRHDFRADQSAIELTDRIDTATQQPNACQVG